MFPGNCGLRSIAVLARSLRTNAHSADMETARALWYATMGVQGEELLQSAGEVAKDPASSRQFRQIALGVLFTQFRPASFLPATFALSTDWPASNGSLFWCWADGGAHFETLRTTMSADVPRRVASVFDEVVADTSAPGNLRSLASCLRAWIREVPRTLDPSRFTVRYYCDNKYQVTYGDTVSAATFEYGDRNFRRKLGIAKGLEHTLEIPGSSPFMLFVNGVLVSETENGRVSCLANYFRNAGKPIPPGMDTLSGWARPRR
jgi:hypothetical protein